MSSATAIIENARAAAPEWQKRGVRERARLLGALRRSLAELPSEDRRMQDGAERGGRRLAAATVQRVLDAA